MNYVVVEIVKNKNTRSAVHFNILEGPYIDEVPGVDEEKHQDWAHWQVEQKLKRAQVTDFEVVRTKLIRISDEDTL